MSTNTQLTLAEGYDPKRQMIFSEPEKGSVPDSIPKIEYMRISISSRNEDGTIGELVIPTERLFSFGVQTATSQETGKITGYTMPLCLWNREQPTREEKIWVDTFGKIVNTCIDHLLEIKEEIDQENLTRQQLTAIKGGLDPLYWKKEKITDENGKMRTVKVTDQGPTLYAKLIFSKKDNKFKSQLFDPTDSPVDALDLRGKFCYVKAAIKIESIFISGTGKISLQVKLYEAVVEPSQSGMKRLLERPKAKSLVIASEQENRSVAAAMSKDDNPDGEGSLDDFEDSEDKNIVAQKPTVKRIVKKTVVKNK